MSQTKFGLPNEIIFCKKCTISNQKPTTTHETKHDANQKKQLLTSTMMEFVMHVIGQNIKKPK